MLRLIVKIGLTYKTYDFDCPLLQADLRNRPEMVGLELLSPGARLLAVDPEQNMEFVESAPVDLPKLGPLELSRFVDDLRAAGCAVEAS